MSPIPTKLTIAPRGYSWHGQKLQKDLDGLPCRPVCTPPATQGIASAVAVPAMPPQGVRSSFDGLLSGELAFPIGFWVVCCDCLTAFLPSERAIAERRT